MSFTYQISSHMRRESLRIPQRPHHTRIETVSRYEVTHASSSTYLNLSASDTPSQKHAIVAPFSCLLCEARFKTFARVAYVSTRLGAKHAWKRTGRREQHDALAKHELSRKNKIFSPKLTEWQESARTKHEY